MDEKIIESTPQGVMRIYQIVHGERGRRLTVFQTGGLEEIWLLANQMIERHVNELGFEMSPCSHPWHVVNMEKGVTIEIACEMRPNIPADSQHAEQEAQMILKLQHQNNKPRLVK